MAENNESIMNDTANWHKELIEMLEFENKAKNFTKDLNFENKSFEEKEKLKADFKEKEKKIEIERNNFLMSIEKMSVQQLDTVVESLQEIYVEQRDLKQQVKKMLTESAFRKRIQTLRKEDFSKVYDLIKFISDKFPVDEYPMYTLKPEAVLYGSEVNKTARGSIYLPPLGNDEIISCLEVFAKKNPWALYNWTMEIFAFDSDKLSSGYKEKFTEERQSLLLQVIEKTKKDATFQKIISDKLFEKGDLARIINLQVTGNKAKNQVKTLEDKIKEMELIAEEKERSYWERANKQKVIIDEKEACLEQLKGKVKNYNEMSLRLSDCMKRHDAQVRINENLVIEYEKKTDSLEKSKKMIQEESEKLQFEISELKNVYENVKSDLSLKTTELSRMMESLEETEVKARESVLCELVSSIKEQLYYISMFYMELEENGSLDQDSIEMFGSTVQNINDALKEIGIEVYGKLEEIVEYDSSLHDAMGSRLSNGERAIIRVPGWKINGSVYSKAQVEKEN